MQTDKTSSTVNVPNSPATAGQAEPDGGQQTARRISKAVYRKSVLRRLGLLRSVAGSDPFLLP